MLTATATPLPFQPRPLVTKPPVMGSIETFVKDIPIIRPAGSETIAGEASFPTERTELKNLRWALIHESEDGLVVQFPGGGTPRTKLFKIADYAGKDQAHDAAMFWRDEQAARLGDVLVFPTQKIFWSTAEVDAIADRIALLETFKRHGTPMYGDNVLYFARMAVVQVLPYTRWRRLTQANAIPRTLVMRLTHSRNVVEQFEKAFLAETGTPFGVVVARLYKKDHPESIAPASPPVPTPAPAPAPIVPPPPKTEPQREYAGSLGMIEGYIIQAIEARTGPFMQDVLKRVGDMETRVSTMAQHIGKFMDDSEALLQRAGSQVEACTLVPADVEDVKQMQSLLTEELDVIRKLAGDMEEAKDGFETRLREIEGAMFRRGIAAPVSNGHDGHSVGHVQPVKPCVIPVIAVLGPLPDQFEGLRERVGNAAKLIFLNNDHSGSVVAVPSGAGWAVCNRFCNHSEQNTLKQKLGSDHVVFVSSGGISSMVRAVMEIVERVNRGGAK